MFDESICYKNNMHSQDLSRAEKPLTSKFIGEIFPNSPWFIEKVRAFSKLSRLLHHCQSRTTSGRGPLGRNRENPEINEKKTCDRMNELEKDFTLWQEDG